MPKRSVIRMSMEQNTIMIGVINHGYMIPVGIITKHAFARRIFGEFPSRIKVRDITPYINHSFIDKVEGYIDTH